MERIRTRPSNTSGPAISEMTYGPLGDSGLMVSAVGIGCNAFSRRVDDEGVADILAAARDTGVTLLDTADAYGVTWAIGGRSWAPR